MEIQVGDTLGFEMIVGSPIKEIVKVLLLGLYRYTILKHIFYLCIHYKYYVYI